MKKQEILLIGTVHVFDLSYSLVKIFDEEKPDIICVELDEARYRSAITNKRDIKRAPFFLKQIFKIEKGLAKKYGVKPAADMLIAIYYAQAHRIPLEFIDMDVHQIVNRCRKAPWYDKAFLSFGLLMGRIILIVIRKRGFEFIYKRSNKKNDIGPSPFFNKFIKDERNKHMADKLRELSKKYQKILVCVGDRHLSGISEIFDSYNINYRTIKVDELQGW